MPLGEILGEIILQPLFELVFYGLSYWTGFIVLKVVSIGSIRLAPLLTIQDQNEGKEKWHQIDWSIWLRRPKQERALKAECTCFVGFLVWVAIGFGIYFGIREEKPPAKKALLQTPAPLLQLGWHDCFLACQPQSKAGNQSWLTGSWGSLKKSDLAYASNTRAASQSNMPRPSVEHDIGPRVLILFAPAVARQRCFPLRSAQTDSEDL